MKLRLPKPANTRRGALMGVALLMMLCSGLFLASWITILSTRAIQVSWLEAAVQRRISLENSRLMAWQTTMSQGFDPEVDLAGKSALLLGGKGGGLNTDSGWRDLALYEVVATNKVTPYNQTGLRPGATFFIPEKFIRPVMPTGTDLDGFSAHQLLKSNCPVINGDLIMVYRKPDRYPASNLLDVYKTTSAYRVEGRVVVRHPPSLFARGTSTVTLPMYAKSVYIQSYDAAGGYPITGTDLDGKKMMPSNLPVVPSSSGPDSKEAGRLFDGYLNVINNEANPGNSLWHKMEAGGANTVEVFNDALDPANGYWMTKYYDQPPLPPPDFEKGGYEVPYKSMTIKLASLKKHLRIVCNGAVTDQIIFEGQSAADYDKAGAMSPVIVTLIQGSGAPMRNIVFKGENNRRLILGIQKLSSLNTSSESYNDTQLICTWAGEPLAGRELRWRMTLVNEGHNLLLNLHDNSAYDVTWIGGVMTNWSFRRNTNTGPRAERLTFKPDRTVPTLEATGPSYASLLPRDAWLESYFLPDRPEDL